MKYIFTYLPIMLVSSLIFISCSAEKRFQSDRSNRLTKKAKVSHHHLAKQAIVITQENIENKETRQKLSRKEQIRHQKELNELNNQSSKVAKKKKKKFSGDFMFY